MQGDALILYLFAIAFEYSLSKEIQCSKEQLAFMFDRERSKRIEPKLLCHLDFAFDQVNKTTSQS